MDWESVIIAVGFAIFAIAAMSGASRRDEEGRLGDALAIVGIVILVGVGVVIYNGGI